MGDLEPSEDILSQRLEGVVLGGELGDRVGDARVGTVVQQQGGRHVQLVQHRLPLVQVRQQRLGPEDARG